METIHTLNGMRWHVREGTNDGSTITSCVGVDEYGLYDVDVDGAIVFDIGAHIGGIGVWLASRGACSICLEPVPENAEMIRKNAALNGVEDQVIVIEGAAGKDGETAVARYNWTGDENLLHHAWVGNVGGDAPGEGVGYDSKIVPCYGMAGLVHQFGVPDVMKLDCEGGEWPLLYERATSRVPLIVGEWHPTAEHPTVQDLKDSFYLWGRPTHDLEISGPEGGPGGFTARIRVQ